MRVGDEILWDIEEHATLFIEPNAAQAGAGRITLAVAGLEALLERLAAIHRLAASGSAAKRSRSSQFSCTGADH